MWHKNQGRFCLLSWIPHNDAFYSKPLSSTSAVKNHWSHFCPYTFAFLRLSSKWNQNHLLIRLFFLHWITLTPLLKNQLTECVGLFLDPLFCFSDLYIRTCDQSTLIAHNCQVSIRQCGSLILLFFKNYFGSFRSFIFFQHSVHWVTP